MKKYEYFIEVTSDWATIEFKGANLSKTNIIVLDGKVKFRIDKNKVFLTLKKFKSGVFKSRRGGTILSDYFSRMKFSFVIRGNKQIESILLEKGDEGKVDVEINGNHFYNTLNIPNNSRNTIEVFLGPQKGKELELKSEFKSETSKALKVELPKRKKLIKYPSVLIVTPTKNDAHYLSRYLEAWEKVDYPREKIRWVWIYGKSRDGTMKILDKHFSKGKWNCEIYSESQFENLTKSAMWIADVMNSFKKVYQGEDFVILSDSDVVRIDPILLKELIGLDLDIVAPYAWHDGRLYDFFDTYVFRDLDGNKYPHHNVPHIDSSEPIELSSAGTMLLIKGEVFDKIKFGNPCPMLQFCKNARKKGYKVWAAPWVKIFHADVFKEGGESHFSPEHYVETGVLPKSILKRVK